MLPLLSRLADLLINRRRTVLLAWAGFVLMAIIVGSGTVDRLETEATGDTSVESAIATEQLEALGQGSPDLIAVIDNLTPTTQQEIQTHVARITALPNVAYVAHPFDETNPQPLLRFTDGQAAMVAVVLQPGLDDHSYDATVETIAEDLRSIDPDNVLVGGQAVFEAENVEQTEKDLQKAELLSLPVVLLLAVFIFGGLLAASMPLLVAVVAIPGSLLILRLLTMFTDIHVFALNAATMLGLGLAVDYSLLVVNRFREERSAGQSVDEAVRRTVTTAGVTVAFSGLTVAVALSGFLVLSGNVFPSIGYGSMGVVLLAMFSSLTLLPAMLSAFGHRIKPAAPHRGNRFRRVAESVQRRPLVVLLSVTAFLLLLAAPFLDVRLQIPGAESLPSALESRQLFDVSETRFAIGADNPITVVIDGATQAEAQAFSNEISTLPNVVGVQMRTTFGSTQILDVLPSGTAQGPAAEDVVAHIRGLDTGAISTAVTGPAADLADQRASLFGRLPYALGLVAAATMVLLFMLTGSVIIPLKALVMNLLSLSATFGVLVWGFQNGALAGLLGFDEVGYLSLWTPFLVFFIAFGLSMDYEVFLLSRIKEVYDETGDNDLAVAEGLQRTGRIITSAALLIGVVFAAFATGAAVEIKALGVGFALAILLDATVVRTLLVPAAMALMGDRNWWAPAPLRRFHERFGLHEPPSAPSLETPDPVAISRPRVLVDA